MKPVSIVNTNVSNNAFFALTFLICKLYAYFLGLNDMLHTLRDLENKNMWLKGILCSDFY